MKSMVHKNYHNFIFSLVQEKQVISNCRKPTEEEHSHQILKPIMKESWSYIRDTSDFLEKGCKY